MKKTLATLSALGVGLFASQAGADTYNLTEMGYTNPPHYNYFLQSDTLDGTPSWKVTKNSQNTTLQDYGTHQPGTNDVAFIGYDFVYENGVQYAVSNDASLTLTMPQWFELATPYYVGENVTFKAHATFGGPSNLVNSGIGENDATIRHANLGASTDTLFTMDKYCHDGTLTLTGNLIMTEKSFSRTLLTGQVYTGRDDGGIDISGLNVTDANGRTLVFTSDEANIGQAGYFWLEKEQGSFANNFANTTYTIRAMEASIPEPATATLSLLALAGLAARRRRK